VADYVLPQVASQKPAREREVLREQALIEPKLMAQQGNIFIGSAKAQHRAHRVTRNEPDDQEHDDAHRDQ
jgi:hypothetical protein